MLAVVVCHVSVEKVVVIPSHHAKVRPDAAKAALDMVGCNGVKSAANVQEGSKAVQPCVYMTFYIVHESRCSSLCRFVAAKAVLVRVYWSKPDALFHMPGA